MTLGILHVEGNTFGVDLIDGPSDVCRCSNIVEFSMEKSKWEIKVLQVVMWGSKTMVSLEVPHPTQIKCDKSRLTVVNKLSIMDKVEVSGARWSVRVDNILPFRILLSWVLISKCTNKQVAHLAVS